MPDEHFRRIETVRGTAKQMGDHAKRTALTYPRKLRSMISLFLRYKYCYAMNLVHDTGTLQDNDEAMLGTLMKAILRTKSTLSPIIIRKWRVIFSIPSLSAVKNYIAAHTATRYWQTGKRDEKSGEQARRTLMLMADIGVKGVPTSDEDCIRGPKRAEEACHSERRQVSNGLRKIPSYYERK